MSWQDDAAAYFRAHEGIVNHFYLDVVGLVTIGVGFLVATADDAARLDLVSRETGVAASEYIKRQEWNAIHLQEKAHLASYYQPMTKLILPQPEIDRLLAEKIQGFAANLGKRWPALDTFPSKVCLGLMDMAYSLGPAGLFRGYPKLCAAVDAKDWLNCASECHRNSVSDQRNKDLSDMFMAAAREIGA